MIEIFVTLMVLGMFFLVALGICGLFMDDEEWKQLMR